MSDSISEKFLLETGGSADASVTLCCLRQAAVPLWGRPTQVYLVCPQSRTVRSPERVNTTTTATDIAIPSTTITTTVTAPTYSRYNYRVLPLPRIYHDHHLPHHYSNYYEHLWDPETATNTTIALIFSTVWEQHERTAVRAGSRCSHAVRLLAL